MGVPIVGYDPVSALLALKDRMDLWRDEGSDNMKAICDYIHEQGYGDISELEARLPPGSRSTMYIERSPQFEVIPTLTNSPKRSGSIATARRLLQNRMRFPGNFSHRPNIADLIRPRKKDRVPIRGPLREGNLAAIAYNDTTPDTAPSTTAWQPRPRRTKSIGRNSIYSEIVIPAYGDGLHNLTSASQTTITLSPPRNSISQASPSEAYTHRPSPTSEDDMQSPPSPCSSSTSSCDSDVPSLSSAYSTDASDSPTLTSPAFSTNNPFGEDDQIKPEATASMELVDVQIVDADVAISASVEAVAAAAAAGEPDFIIDTLTGELEAAALAGKPRYEALGSEKYAVGSGLGVSFD